jgi:SAM-dependent methyltransferase
LLDEFHGPLTIRELEAVKVRPGWRCLEAGAGTGAMTRWLAEKVAPSGRVLAIDIETHLLEPLRGETIEVRQADIRDAALPKAGFDLVLARMLLLHLPDPADVCRQFVEATVSGGQLVIQDADFLPLALEGATDVEASGLSTHNETMRAAGVHLALGPMLESLLVVAGAQIEHVVTESSKGHGGETAALITAMTLEHFREQAVAAGAHDDAISAAIAALRDPDRTFVGPTQWIVRARVMASIS